MVCGRWSQMYVLHVCNRIFMFELYLRRYWQKNPVFKNCHKFHIFTKIVILKVQLERDRPTTFILWILWQVHLSNVFFFFHFRLLWAVKASVWHHFLWRYGNCVLTRLGVPSIAGRLLKVIETCVYDLRHEKGAHCR